jgi:hypothetical protein
MDTIEKKKVMKERIAVYGYRSSKSAVKVGNCTENENGIAQSMLLAVDSPSQMGS